MEISALEGKVEELVELCERLRGQYVAAVAERDGWREESERLRGQHALAKSKVEAMIKRLKGLKQGKGS